MKPITVIKRFWTDCRATAALEFSLVAPVLITAFLTSVSVSDSVRANRTLKLTTNTIADLVTRYDVIGTEDLADLWEVAQAVASPYMNDPNTMLFITSVVNEIDDDQDPTLTIDWSLSNREGMQITEEMLPMWEFPSVNEGDSIIFVVAKMDYSAPFTTNVLPSRELWERGYRRPRFVRQVELTDELRGSNILDVDVQVELLNVLSLDPNVDADDDDLDIDIIPDIGNDDDDNNNDDQDDGSPSNDNDNNDNGTPDDDDENGDNNDDDDENDQDDNDDGDDDDGGSFLDRLRDFFGRLFG